MTANIFQNRFPKRALVLVGLIILSGCTYTESPGCDGLEVTDLWVREAPTNASVQAGYFNVYNAGGKEVVVHGVESPDFDRVEMHETVTANGTSSMRPVSAFHVPPRSGASFAAGGKHLMLFKPRLKYVAGDRVQLRFICGSEAQRMPIAAEVRSSKPVTQDTE